MAESGLSDGPLFRAINRHGQMQSGRLSGVAVACILNSTRGRCLRPLRAARPAATAEGEFGGAGGAAAGSDSSGPGASEGGGAQTAELRGAVVFGPRRRSARRALAAGDFGVARHGRRNSVWRAGASGGSGGARKLNCAVDAGEVPPGRASGARSRRPSSATPSARAAAQSLS